VAKAHFAGGRYRDAGRRRCPRCARFYACVLGWRDTHGVSEYGVLLILVCRDRSASRRRSIRPANADADRWRGLALGIFLLPQAHYADHRSRGAVRFGAAVDMVPVERVTHRSA